MGRFVRGWVFDATFVGLSCGFGFYFIGIDNALPLGVVSGIGHLVPYFGPIIGGVPAIIFSIIQYGDLSHVPFIFLLILGVYTLDNGFVQPYVFAKSVDMHPIVIILLILAGSQLLGIIGMLLAVPMVAGMQVVKSKVPLSAMFGYSTDLRSKTQGRGSYSMEFSHYEEVPKSIADGIIATATGGKAE